MLINICVLGVGTDELMRVELVVGGRRGWKLENDSRAREAKSFRNAGKPEKKSIPLKASEAAVRVDCNIINGTKKGSEDSQTKSPGYRG
jgi:hypothetical protein